MLKILKDFSWAIIMGFSPNGPFSMAIVGFPWAIPDEDPKVHRGDLESPDGSERCCFIRFLEIVNFWRSSSRS